MHRLHPYKGKFIPQLVEYFIDGHTDNFKKASYLKKGDIILDPFVSSGTTLHVAKKMKRNSLGIDIVPEYIEMIKNEINENELVFFEPKIKYEEFKS